MENQIKKKIEYERGAGAMYSATVDLLISVLVLTTSMTLLWRSSELCFQDGDTLLNPKP